MHWNFFCQIIMGSPRNSNVSKECSVKTCLGDRNLFFWNFFQLHQSWEDSSMRLTSKKVQTGSNLEHFFDLGWQLLRQILTKSKKFQNSKFFGGKSSNCIKNEFPQKNFWILKFLAKKFQNSVFFSGKFLIHTKNVRNSQNLEYTFLILASNCPVKFWWSQKNLFFFCLHNLDTS